MLLIHILDISKKINLYIKNYFVIFFVLFETLYFFRSSNLKDWVIEKSKGNIQESDIHTLTIQEMHKGGSDAVFNKLLSILPNQVLIVDTVDQNDLNIFVSGLLKVF